MPPDIDSRMIAGLIVPRLDGGDIESRMDEYRRLVRLGIGGFIVFGGRKDSLAEGIEELRKESDQPLFIMSDLEQGLGQQVAGGTTFPPAMALARALDLEKEDELGLFRNMIEILAMESRETGINTILAPVADIHTNPENPIICTRAFGKDPASVSAFVGEYVRALQDAGIKACAKHFPGHGDTDRDSHVELPVLRHGLDRLGHTELIPFRSAIENRVSMVMVGHLRVDAIDPDHPATLSPALVDGLLRRELGYDGVVITDAMNMGAVREVYGEEQACLMALMAGCDILLHPENPESVISIIESSLEKAGPRIVAAAERVRKLRDRLDAGGRGDTAEPQGAKAYPIGPDELVSLLSEKALKMEKGLPNITGREMLFIIDEDDAGGGRIFYETLKEEYPDLSVFRLSGTDTETLPDTAGRPVIAALFSRIAGWKGRSGLSAESRETLKAVLAPAGESTLVSFGCPSLLSGLDADTVINAWWEGEAAQKAAAQLLCGKSC